MPSARVAAIPYFLKMEADHSSTAADSDDGDDSDFALMKRIGSGDHAAFRQLVERHQHAVIGTVAKMLGNAAESEDIAQQVFLRIWRHAKRYRPEAKFTTYLFTITRNLVFNETRRKSRKKEVSADERAENSHQLIAASPDRQPDAEILQAELQGAVDAAIALFSGEKSGEQAREIWLVEKAPIVIQKLEAAVQQLETFMKSQGLDCTPSAVANLKGDAAKAAFCTQFKEVQRLKTQLDQYTDLTEENKASIEQVLPEENLRGFKGQYLETAKRLKEQQGKPGSADVPVGSSPIDQIDFEFVLFASAVIDYDYIMGPSPASLQRRLPSVR